MASREFQPIHTIGRGKVILHGRFTTDGAGAVGTTTQQGAGFTVTKPGATTGVYRVNLGRSTSFPDRYESLVSAQAIILNTTAQRYRWQIDAHSVSAATPYVDFLISTESTAATIAVVDGAITCVDPAITVVDGAITVVDAAITVTPVTSTTYTDVLRGAAYYAGLFPHVDPTGMTAIASANATDLASLKTLCQEICTRMESHDDDATAHRVADTGNLEVAAWTGGVPADAAECIAIVNEVKADWNAHIVRVNGALGANVHAGYSPIDLVVNADAIAEADAYILANEIKLRYNNSRNAAYTTSVAAVSVMTGATAAHAAASTASHTGATTAAHAAATTASHTSATTATTTPSTTASAADLLSSELVFEIVLSTTAVN